MRGSFSACAMAAAVSDGCRWMRGACGAVGCGGGSTSMGAVSVLTSTFSSTFTSGFTSGFTSIFASASALAAALSSIAAVAIASW